MPSKAPWQDRFTLGPGDTLNLVLLNPDMPETARAEVPVGPDGRITFLQARDVMAAGSETHGQVADERLRAAELRRAQRRHRRGDDGDSHNRGLV